MSPDGFDPADHFIKEAQVKAADKGWHDLSDREVTAVLFGWLAHQIQKNDATHQSARERLLQTALPTLGSGTVAGAILYAAIRLLEA